ncbi:MAG: ubiquinone/menaquinone biosynthesis methyltransferase UbiE [Desulfuromonas sp.]|nr:MAG: ubiquinone/menaquinone biosynthesis methyltransferase UbiE [Desulfuromonas sp.]
MSQKPVAAGKSSYDLIDSDKLMGILALDPGATVLDLACGAGRYSTALAAAVGPQGKVYAVDLWQEGLSQLDDKATRAGLAQIETLLADICTPLQLPDNAIEACLLATILHDLSSDEQGQVIREAARLLKQDGTLTIVEFKKLDYGPGPRITIRLDEAQIDALVTPYGFSKSATAELGKYTYLQHYTKKDPA